MFQRHLRDTLEDEDMILGTGNIKVIGVHNKISFFIGAGW